MKTYVSIPVHVTAIQFDGTNQHEIYNITNGLCWSKDSDTEMFIETKEGIMTVSLMDYVVKEPFPTGDRDFYPVKQSIFEKRYKEVE